jgi:WD40 repeat protein
VSGDETLLIYDILGDQLTVCRGHECIVTSLCVTEDNKIVSGSYDKTVRVWDMQGNQLAVCRGHEESVFSVCATGDNKIVSVSGDKTVRVWDMQGNELAVCRGHGDEVLSVYMTGDNKIVSGSWDNTVRVWDTAKFTLLGKALLSVSESLEKSAAIWDLILKYSAGTEDRQNFRSGLKALIG